MYIFLLALPAYNPGLANRLFTVMYRLSHAQCQLVNSETSDKLFLNHPCVTSRNHLHVTARLSSLRAEHLSQPERARVRSGTHSAVALAPAPAGGFRAPWEPSLITAPHNKSNSRLRAPAPDSHARIVFGNCRSCSICWICCLPAL